MNFIYASLQMTKLGYRFNYNHHKKWLLWPTVAVAILTHLLVYCSVDTNYENSSVARNVIVYFYAVFVCEGQFVIFRVYIFLLANTRIRFRQLNQCLMYRAFKYIPLNNINKSVTFLLSDWKYFSEIIPNGFCINSAVLDSTRFDYSDEYLINKHARLYDKLIDVLTLINKCYSVQVTQ